MGRNCLVCFGLVVALVGCGDDGGGLADYYPDLPKETGGAQEVFAGEVTSATELVTGPAQSGLVGDFYIKNDKATFIIQAPTRVIGVVPQGGNVVDAVLTDGTKQIVDDHFGELGLIYMLGRTCAPDRVEIVRDGSKGGVAVIRTIGKAESDDFLNLKGIGVLPVDPTVDPDIEDGVLCATTYVLAPGSTSLQVSHSLFNDGPDKIASPLGTLADTGGFTEGWTNASGFQRADISQLTSLSRPQPIDYVLYQGPGVAYGIVPRHKEAGVEHAQAVVAGVSIFLDGNSSILDILQKDKYFLHMDPGKGAIQTYDFVVGKDGADIDEVYRAGNGEELRAVAGMVTMSAGGPATGARVGVFLDGNGNGQIDEMDADSNGQPDDKILSYMDVAADGSYSGNVATTAGNLLLRAEVKNIGRSPSQPVASAMNFVVPSPIKVDFQILDQDTTMPIPGRLLVIGDHPAFPDKRVFETYDRLDHVVTQQHAIRGTTVDVGDGTDPAIYLPANGTYRIYASRGTEWSIASAPVSGASNVNLTFTLKHVVPTPGYISSDWHVHQIGSPDSNVPSDERIRSAVSSGTEMFATTDHDYVSALQPLVEQMNLQEFVRALPGIEVTPFAYGHFNSWPIQPDNNSANHGAIDWARGRESFAMTPGEIFQAMRDRGARMVQVNHPREVGFTEFQGAWARANVKFDYTNRMIFGDYQNASVPNDYLRLPGESLWSDQFTGLEVWNGFQMADANADGVRENKKVDRTMRDWMAMLSLGLFVTPAGNSDTHTAISDPIGMPRTMIRVADDSVTALVSGSAADAVLQTQTGANQTPRDVVVTNGPMIEVKIGSVNALGRVFPSAGGAPVTLTVTITSPDWAEFDTLEVFANSTPDPLPRSDDTNLQPLQCWTSRTIANLNAMDPCKTAAMPAQTMNVTLANISGPGSYKRYEATVTVTLDDQDIVTRAGKTGTDAWLVFRVRGDRAIFPVLLNNALEDPGAVSAVMTGDFNTIRTALTGKGVPAEAFTSPVFLDFDGGGYRAPFAP